MKPNPLGIRIYLVFNRHVWPNMEGWSESNQFRSHIPTQPF